MQITVPRLPYLDDALEPHISRTTLRVHHGQHHRAYAENVGSLARQVRLTEQSLERILQQTVGQYSHHALFKCGAGLEPRLLLALHEADRPTHWGPGDDAGVNTNLENLR